MWRKLQISAVLLAWLLATGSQWDLAQVFAWGQMIANYSRTMPVSEAIRMTFTQGNECGICVAVDEAKQQQDSPTTPATKAPGKILLVFQPVPVIVIIVPDSSPWPSGGQTMLGASRASPPVPPPRVA